ncbi:PREDICTED: MAM and LDL-receptor class A domain-containing protein 1-like [Branchiostoma belcheri]|uniref:MAM and LDL-receptor class A domain-containing protein 1-like n=1 Tax=Branchiostoma belcheri TaxID=7741 RepID=A0A6P4XJ00_BRABE|nr:PREDICTED: MAM and LDL-receptor class A domain-containing protein 1-like [Branchiostoma belcheri]
MEWTVTVCAFVLIVQHLQSGQCTTWSCDFETSDLCGYTQDTANGQDWIRHSGPTPTTNTGPSVDHTLGTALGYYMYLETSVPGNQGDAARLVSSPFPANSAPYCLRFYYHMFGDSTGTLNVYIRKQGILGTPVWTVSGNQGNAWQFGHAQMDGSSSFNVVFEAVRGNGFRGDIAIDDVTVSDECVPIPTTVLPTTTPFPDSSAFCTFELSSICGYRQDIHDSAEWTWHQGHTSTGDTGPGVDHTLGTVQGHYMYFEASNIDPGVTARLLSPTLPVIPSSSSHTSYCLTFWYHMYGLHIGTLNVNQKERGGSEAPIWSLSDEQGNAWQQGQLPLGGTTESTVVFEAVRGSSYKGDIAIDDVEVIQYRGQCELIPASAMVPLPSTPTITTQSSSTSAYLSTSGSLSAATTAEQPSTAMSTEVSSASVTIATGTSLTTDRTPPATTASVPTTPTITAQSSFTTDRIPSATTDGVPHTPTITSTRADLTTSGTLPIETLTTEGQTTEMWTTETSSTASNIVTEPSTTPDRPTTLQTGPTFDVETTAALTSTAVSTEPPSTVSTTSAGQTTTTTDSLPLTDRTTPVSVGPMGTSSTQSSRTTRFGTTMGGNLSSGQTGNNTATTIIIAVAVVLSLVFGVVVGVVATVSYKKKKRTRSGHAKVKYVADENKPASADDSFPGVVDGRVEFENPTFEHIYEELPNVVANHTASRQEQRPLSAISSVQNEVYMEINDHEVCGAKASSQQPVPVSKGDGHISSPVNALFPSPRQDHQGVRHHGGHRKRNAEDGYNRQGYRRDHWGTENDYLPPVNDPNVQHLNHSRSNDEDYERIRTDPYQNLNPRHPAHYEGLRPDHYQRLNAPGRAPNPDGYQSLRQNQYQHLNAPERAQNPDGYQSLR